MKLSLLFTILVFITIPVSAQKTTTAIKIDEVDLENGGTELVVARAKMFLRSLAAADNDTYGFITIYSNEPAAIEMKKTFSKEPDLQKRIEMFEPGRKYQGEWHNVEFWLLPPGSEMPYSPWCSFCDCPTISVDGPASEQYELSFDRPLVFTVSVSGGSQDSVEYVWKIENGEIVDGQGTPSITVKPNMSDPKDIPATVEIKGMDPRCACPNTASAKARLKF